MPLSDYPQSSLLTAREKIGIPPLIFYLNDAQ